MNVQAYARKYRGIVMVLVGIILIGIEIGPHLIKEIGTALVVAGILTLFIDEYTKQEIINTIKKSQLEIRSTDARSFLSILYKRSIPNHVWNHCEELFKANFRREGYTAVYDLDECTLDINGIKRQVVKVRLHFEFKVVNITESDQIYNSKYRLEADGIDVNPQCVKKLEVRQNDKPLKIYTPEQISLMCSKEHEFDTSMDTTQKTEAIYLLWQGDPITVRPDSPITVTQVCEYYRELNDSDKFLSSAAANKLTVTINHSKDFNVIAFHVSPKRPHMVYRPTSKTISIEDATPYQGIVFSWSKNSSLAPPNDPL